jgi:hypothetical protein
MGSLNKMAATVGLGVKCRIPELDFLGERSKRSGLSVIFHLFKKIISPCRLIIDLGMVFLFAPILTTIESFQVARFSLSNGDE